MAATNEDKISWIKRAMLWVEDIAGGPMRLKGSQGALHTMIVNPSGALLGSGSWEVVDDQTLSSSALSFTFSGLDGDEAYIYRLTGLLISGNAACVPAITCNGVGGTSYETLMSVLSTTYAGTAYASQPQFAMMNAALASGDSALIEAEIYSANSALHVIKSRLQNNAGTGGVTYLATGQFNAGSAAAISSIVVTANSGGSGLFAAGSRVQLSRMALSA
ncbi:hypothetical protein [Primorskyibacter sedentarius]|uniref:hypothetical protein n=1 Tax=Primorskyibacter sedentarius TaxID=745311 RepID=UPI003EBDA9C8